MNIKVIIFSFISLMQMHKAKQTSQRLMLMLLAKQKTLKGKIGRE